MVLHIEERMMARAAGIAKLREIDAQQDAIEKAALVRNGRMSEVEQARYDRLGRNFDNIKSGLPPADFIVPRSTITLRSK